MSKIKKDKLTHFNLYFVSMFFYKIDNQVTYLKLNLSLTHIN